MKQVRFPPHDANLVIGDLNALGKGAQVVPPIAASFDPQTAACGFRKRVDHVWRNGPVPGAAKSRPYPLGVRRRLIADRFEIGDPVLQSHVVQRGHTRFDRIVEPTQSLIRLGDSPI
ncbi:MULTISPECIES: hypothetical protein [unclassified Agrobacterium]|uniref:hypothetical protein n=1 Tax=Agrobacterium sp. 224MFTsu3.1 TaxID=1167635 RepID=UPI0004784A87